MISRRLDHLFPGYCRFGAPKAIITGEKVIESGSAGGSPTVTASALSDGVTAALAAPAAQ